MNVLNVVLDFLAVEKPPYDVIIVLSTPEALQAPLHFGTQRVTLRPNNETLKLAFKHVVGQILLVMEGTDSEYSPLDPDSESTLKESDFIAFCHAFNLKRSKGST